MDPEKSQVKPSGPAVEKRRACDSCRNRKLACTKEPDGCSRCRREGIDCHYSPQKPMGRPRKRRIVEDQPHSDEEAPAIVNVGAPSAHLAGPADATAHVFGVNVPGNDLPPPVFDDPTFAYLDQNQDPTSSLDFLDLLPAPSYQDALPMDPHILIPNDGQLDSIGMPLNFSGVDLLEGISFDEPDTSVTDMSKDISDSLQRYWHSQQQVPEAPESQYFSSDQSQFTASPESQSEPQAGGAHTETEPQAQPTQSMTPGVSTPCGIQPVPSVACGCLSSLYLALDALSRLPEDVNTAVRVARNAVRTAHSVTNCSDCSDPDITKPPPIQSFQTLMFLAALVPSACNAYATILQMIDRETKAAKSAKRSFWFSFQNIGGIWCGAKDLKVDCPETQAFDNRDMEPDLWRTTMRAMLRLDVYGLTPAPGGLPETELLGLRDVVKVLEERSHKRHDTLDKLAESGAFPKHGGFLFHPGNYVPMPSEQRNCMKVLEAARIALDHLVIA